MSWDLTCPHCQQLFRPAAEQGGKLAACPHCGKQVRIPSGDSRPPIIKQDVDPRWKTPTTIWFVQAEDGKQYGPVTGEQLHAWYEEGRITADCQLLRKGAEQWQWATDLYPDLELALASKSPPQPEARPAHPRLTEIRAAPAQSTNVITPLSPDDFPTAGAGLKPLGPLIRPLLVEDTRYRSMEAREDRRKFAPYMVARIERPPLHKMLIVVAIGNFVVGTLRAGAYFVAILNVVLMIGALGEDGKGQDAKAALAVSLGIVFLMLVLNISIIAGGIGLLQQKEWGRTATYAGTLIGMLVQLTSVCVITMLGAGGSVLDRSILMVILVVAGPSILFDAAAASILTIPSVVEHLED